MNSLSFGLAGSWWFLILLALIGIALALFSYRKTVPPVSGFMRILLTSLRSIGIILLLFALFEPVMNFIKGSEKPPSVAILYDNSISAGLRDASGERSEIYKNALEEFGRDNFESKKEILFSDEISIIEAFHPDSIDFTGQMTDIASAVSSASRLSRDENLRAAVLFSDGSFNSGDNPLYNAESFGKPLYIVGIGDTNRPVDIAVRSIITNEIAYIDNPVPVNVNLNSSGIEGSFSVKMLDNGKEVNKQEVEITPGKQDYTLVFSYTPKEEGVRKIDIKAEELEDEITYKNNIASEFIRVKKNKRRIAIFGGAPSSDISFLKQELTKEKNLGIDEYIQKKNAEFYNEPTQRQLDEAEIIILAGFPISSTPANVMDMIENELRKGKPLMFIPSGDLDYKKLNRIEDYLPFTVLSSGQKELNVSPFTDRPEINHPLMKIEGTDEDVEIWNNQPPVFKTETFVRVKPGAEVLMSYKLNGVEMDDPLLTSSAIGNNKTMAFLGYGLYRWKLLGYAPESARGNTEAVDVYSKIISNSLRWLSVRETGKTTRVKPVKDLFAKNELIEFTGQVYDAALRPINDAVINVTIRGAELSNEITLSPIGNGRYYASMEGLPEGEYSFEATIIQQGKVIGTDDGRFTVGDLSIEYSDLTMNISMLRMMAERTGGKFYLASEARQAATDILANPGFQPRAVTQRTEFALWNNPWLLVLSILAFAGEWIIRKRLGMV
ncbi:MAG: hypothetical protein ACLFQU_01390 [Candidatus Kapaibacterium sp.]